MSSSGKSAACMPSLNSPRPHAEMRFQVRVGLALRSSEFRGELRYLKAEERGSTRLPAQDPFYSSAYCGT